LVDAFHATQPAVVREAGGVAARRHEECDVRGNCEAERATMTYRASDSGSSF
jgi:hypothetical protein